MKKWMSLPFYCKGAEMIDISDKAISLRKARASGRILCDGKILERIKKGDLPKGNLFDVARAAGMLGAKNTAGLIPHCHPISIDGLDIDFELQTDGILIRCEVRSIGRTGVEMEAMTAVSVSALTIYDLLKPITKDLVIGAIRLEKKSGGRSDFLKYVPDQTKAAVLVCSDSTAAGDREDRSGKVIQEILKKYAVTITEYCIIPDDPETIRKKIMKWVDAGVPYIITTGGTGLGPRDFTAETVRDLLDREAPGISEAMRSFGQMRTPLAMLSRSVAGVIKNTVVLTLPGSSRGARESLEAILPGLFHASDMIGGEGHADGHRSP